MTASQGTHDAAPASEPLAAQRHAAAFVQRHQRGLWRFLRALGCPADVADELAQDALVLALARAVDDGAAPAFLRQTGKFLWLRRQRDDGRAAARLVAAAEQLWQRDCGHDDGEGLLAALRTCRDGLPARARQAIDLFYGDDAGRAGLSHALGLSEHGARTLLQRTRAQLRACIERKLRP